MVEYAENYEVEIVPVPRRGILQLAPGQGVMGYGNRISTDRKIRFKGEKIWRRVYAICYSNAASHYVRVKGKKLFCHGYDLEV